MANKHSERCSTLCVIREVHIETTRYHYLPMRLTKNPHTDKPHAVKDTEQQELLFILMGIEDGTATLENSWQCLPELNIILPYDPVTTLLGFIQMSGKFMST